MVGWYKDKYPQIHVSVFIAFNAVVIGDVVIGKDSSIWFGSLVRGDTNHIRIGKLTNVQDYSILHVTHKEHPLIIGDEVTIAHKVIAHGCTIGSRCLIGMGAILMDGVVVGDESIIGAGGIVTPGTKIPPKSMVMGFPARVIRELDDREIGQIAHTARHYASLASWYKGEYEKWS